MNIIVFSKEFPPEVGGLETYTVKNAEFLARDDRLVRPIEPIANAVVAWVWACELHAARVRLASSADEARRHGQRASVQPGALGAAYLTKLRSVLRDVGTASWPAIVGTAERAAGAVMDGGRAFVAVDHPYVSHHAGRRLAGDRGPRVLTRLTGASTTDLIVQPGRGDFVLAIGTDQPPGDEAWGSPDAFRAASRGVTWLTIAGGLGGEGEREGEIVLDPRWPIGDALVEVPGVASGPADGGAQRLGAASGVVAETILWAIQAQVQAIVTEHNAAKKPRRAPDPPLATAEQR